MQAYIIGIDLGGMSAKAALFDKEGRIVAKKSIVTNAADGFEGTAAKLAEVAGVDTAEANQKQKARDFIAWLTRLNEEMHLPAAFEQIREEDLEELSAHAEREANPLYPVPKEMGKEDLKKIYRAVMCPARETAKAVGGPNEELL
mgnify:CR=1 FL=1